MLDELYMRDLANAMKIPAEPLPTGTVTVSAPEPEMVGMDKAFVGTRLNVPKPGQPTQQDREKMAIGLLDTLAGAMRGAAAVVGGLPGDIRSILDMINQEGAEKYLGQRSFATTEEILEDTSVRIPGTQIDVPFPPVLKEGVPNRAERQKSVETAQEVGTFLPAPGIPEVAIQGVKAVGKAMRSIKNSLKSNTVTMMDGSEVAIPKAPKVESKAFKNWFGDSKAVDEAGAPVVVYTARRGDFETFDPLKSEGKSAGTGTFFSSSPAVAATYNTSSEHNMVPAYLSLKKPFIVDFNGANWNRGGEDAVVKLADGSEDDLLSYFNAARDETVSTDDVARLAREQGYDGVIINNVMDHGPAGRFATKEAGEPSTVYIAFKPEQIKSVFNKGEFDPTNPNMLLGAGGAAVATQQEENK